MNCSGRKPPRSIRETKRPDGKFPRHPFFASLNREESVETDTHPACQLSTVAEIVLFLLLATQASAGTTNKTLLTFSLSIHNDVTAKQPQWNT
mmetsp:Transcript_20953/g.49435  ORF Transcript_20953/g.49435 Transcript_20953/m.49435 type:complete len:93 (+) Transcript_20953:49-327(+)